MIDRMRGESAQTHFRGALGRISGRRLHAEVAAAQKRLEQARYHHLAVLATRYALGAKAEIRQRLTVDTDLTQFEYSVFSQNGEDGVICELLTRIGHIGCSFVEFGTQTGVEGNCVFLAEVRGWQGLFIEGGDDYECLARRWKGRRSVKTHRAMVTPQNINHLLDEAGVPDEPSIVSIDVDGNDYYIWEALQRRPHIVIIEYNASLPLGGEERLVQPYSDEMRSTGRDFFGASLGALEQLGLQKGYTLTHTDLTGVNAFFVRDDLAEPLPTGNVVPRRAANYQLSGHGHPSDKRGADRYVRV